MNLQPKVLAAAVLVAGSIGLASPASAAPAGPGSPGLMLGGLVTPVAQGCGRGYFRNRRGICRPMRGWAPRYYRPRRAYRRGCFVRPGRYGPVRVCRF